MIDDGNVRPETAAAADRMECDFVVLGGGMAGMSAAAKAARAGACVIVLEKGAAIGGNALLSGGTFWCVDSHESFHELCPNGDAALGEVLVDGYPGAVEWISSTGAKFGPPVVRRRVGRGARFDILAYLEYCRAVVEGTNGWVLPGQRVDQLLVNDGRVVGVRATEDGSPVDIRAPFTLLATGGFQASKALRHEYMGDAGDHLLLRCSPSSTGDGLQLATAVGADLAGDMTSFYGHIVAWPLARFEREEFSVMALAMSPSCIVVNLACQRFIDESIGTHAIAQALARQPFGRGLVLGDGERWESMTSDGGASGVFADAERAGAHVASASTLRELGDSVTAWGFEGQRLISLTGDASSSRCGRLALPKLGEPPFWAIEAKPAITFTEGGLRVDCDARVLAADDRPIVGLLAAGADIGGIYNGGYSGGLALATVFGLRAAQTVIEGKRDWRTPL